MKPARRTPVRRGRPMDNDDTSAKRATEPSRRGRRRQRYCRGVRAVAGVGRRTWCCRDRRVAASGFKREATINMLLRGGVWQGVGVGEAWRPPRPPSETTSLAFFARIDVRRRQQRHRRHLHQLTSTTPPSARPLALALPRMRIGRRGGGLVATHFIHHHRGHRRRPP